MPLSPRDRLFIQTVERLKLYLLLIAAGVFIYLLLTPSTDIQMVTSIVGLALCGVFWLAHRLLSFITRLDLELTRIVNVLKRTLTPEQRKEFFPGED